MTTRFLLLVFALLTVGTAAYAQTVTVAAAGDVACTQAAKVRKDRCQMAATAELIAARNVAAVFALGDLQYPQGSYYDFVDGYDASWGEFKAITHPVPGNHEYYLYGAAGYYRYFGRAAHEADGGTYSFDVGGWHIVALNSNCLWAGGCGADSAQVAWLRRDLQAHPNACTLAFWHHPRFSSGRHGSSDTYSAFWSVLDKAGVDVVLSAHDHHYERFALQRADGAPDPEGIRAFVVGTGGKSLYEIQNREPNSEVVGTDFGVLFLTLEPGSYRWSFESVGAPFSDTGEGACH